MSSVQATVCPKCGFAYGWDGNRCRHCKHGLEGDYSQEKFVSVKELQEVLRRSEPATDEVIVDMFQRFVRFLPFTNVLWSGGNLLGIAGLVCSYRPHLAERILVPPIEWLFFFGARTSDHVLCWADSQVQDRLDALASCSESNVDRPQRILKDLAWFSPGFFNPNFCLKALLGDMVMVSSPEGIDWFQTSLPQYHDFIQDVLDRLRRERDEQEQHEKERQRAENEMRQQRKVLGSCVRCGAPLGIWSRLFAREQHRRCKSDR